MKFVFSVVLLLGLGNVMLNAQVTTRPRPAEWTNLVKGARFIDRFLPMHEGKLSKDVWGGNNVLPRYIDNGIEDEERSYWGGKIIKGPDQKYHLYVCGWPEKSPKGHHTWPESIVYHAICDNSVGPYVIRDTIGPGHNPEVFQAKNGKYVIYVIDGYYLSDSVNGPWTYKTFDFDARDRKIIEGLTNLTFAKREDGSTLMVCRGGGVWISETGLSTYNQITDKRVYPDVEGEFEDPVVWRDHVQYHLIVNDWLGRIAFYQRSKDGVHWVTDPGEAYLPGIISVHKDGLCENWFKYERLKVLQDEYGRAVQANFAVIDTLKNEDLPNDRHNSKNLTIPLNPGMLLAMLNEKPITAETKEVRVLIQAEKDFKPSRDLDLKSLRFGSSEEVNYGKGSKVVGTLQKGNDMIVIFDAKACHIKGDEFAPKIIGQTKTGDMVFGYMRLPWVDYTPPILSARKPIVRSSASLEVLVDNYGLKTSGKSKLELYLVEGDKQRLIAHADIPAVKSYEQVKLALNTSEQLQEGKNYHFMLRIKMENEPDTEFTYSDTCKYIR